MQRLNLPAAMTTSALGFGTAQLMARIGRRESVRLLHAAFDAGITHIDTARLYGYGAAESAVGDLLAGRRHQITVATKFGIFPPARSPMLQTPWLAPWPGSIRAGVSACVPAPDASSRRGDSRSPTPRAASTPA
jgi:D-threo-aldose 1-dehydrogenase